MGREYLINLHIHMHVHVYQYTAIINRGQHTHSLKPVQIAAPTPHGLFTMLYWYMQCVERWIVIFFCISFSIHVCLYLAGSYLSMCT